MSPDSRMGSGSSHTSTQYSAPRILGAVFCVLGLFAIASCDKKSGTPEWDTPASQLPSTSSDALPLSPHALPVVPKTAAARSDDQPEPAPESGKSRGIEPAKKGTAPASGNPGTAGLRFMTYNVENWLTMDRYVDGKSLKRTPKPDKEKQAIIALVARQSPDVIGICEIGEASDLAEIQEKLKTAGLSLPHLYYTGGTDPTRHLGILSRFPVTSTSKPAETEYQLDGKTFGMNRGILDATIEARGKSYRFVGVHLKSKRDSEQGDQEAIRLNEAHLLRRHLDSIIQADPAARVVLYGDFNDTRATPALKAITGNYNSPTYMTAIPANDSNNEAWTHYWALNDIYSRIDYVMTSPALKPDVDFKASKIIDDADWNDASDHRAILAIFK
ncbi:MAG: endonuclease/exonuclease/phosphatase family protein [Luteolibacter sp.]